MKVFENSPLPKAGTGLDYQEIKSHSSLLSNERIAILLYMLDLNSINLNQMYEEKHLLKVKSILYQVYKNVRSVIRNNSAVRIALNLETKVQGIYTLDVAFAMIEDMINYCTFNGYTYKRSYIIAQNLNNIEITLRDVMQYFSYFFRPEYSQKPDVMIASDKYKEMADKMTIEQLKTVIGKKHRIDFEKLGISTEEPEMIEDDSSGTE